MLNEKQYKWLMSSLSIIVAIVIYVMTVLFVPFFTKGAPEITWKEAIPQGPADWVMKLSPSIVGICLFELLFFAGIDKGKDSDAYKQARTLLQTLSEKKRKAYKPESPLHFGVRNQVVKVTFTLIGISALLCSIGVIIPEWDLNTFIALLIALTTSLISAFMSYRSAYKYYSSTILEYAKYITKEESIDGNN